MLECLNDLVGELVDGGCSLLASVYRSLVADLPVLAIDAMEVAVREEDVDDGVEGRFFAPVEADGGDGEGRRSAAEGF